MGWCLPPLKPEQLRTLETWLAESRETSWLAANREGVSEYCMTIPVRVSGQTSSDRLLKKRLRHGPSVAHAALFSYQRQVATGGQRLTLSNVQTKAALECVVAPIDKRRGEHPQAGVEFTATESYVLARGLSIKTGRPVTQMRNPT